MTLKKLLKLLPLSITAYGVLFILLGVFLFGGFTWLAVDEIHALQLQTKQDNLRRAQEEMRETLLDVFERSETLAKQFAGWDETVQQLSNSTYYAYWRAYRVPSASFVPNYLASLELYDRRGVALATPRDKGLPEKITLPASRIRLVKQSGRVHLVYSHPIDSENKSKSNGIGGYVVIKLDLKKALIELQRFKYADVNTLLIDMREGESIDEANIVQRIHVSDVPNTGFNQLQSLMESTLIRFLVIGVSMALLLLYFLAHIFALPSRRLSHHIDALRHGDLKLLQDPRKHKLAVAEFEKIRLSLNHYQTQLDSRDAALRESEMRMRAVLDNVVDGIITIDEEGVIESANPTVNRIFGLQGQDIVGSSITALITDSTLPVYYSYCDRCFQNTLQSNEFCELMGKRSDQSEFPIEIALSRMQVAQRDLFIAVVRDITERKRAQERLVYQANYDELTGLPNRVLFRDRLGQAIARAKREDRLVGVVFFDLDHFKRVNDTLGHHAGDQLLLGASARLKEILRESDTVARPGGDEFMVILGSIRHVDEITNIVTNLLQSLEKPFWIEGQEAFVAASAGIAIYPFDDLGIDNLVKNADTAMFRAKAQGGNTYRYFKAEMNANAVQRLKLDSALRYALERNEFELHYQPRVDLNNGAICGLEVLLRWQSPELGSVPPTQFIPILEETGLIIPVGDWVLKTACEQTRRWHQAGYDLCVSVNLSVRQFRQKDLVNHFRAIWNAAGFNPAYLELEITEGLLIENMELAARILGDLHNDGVHISIDDFGVGYSSLSYLKRFPIDLIKIDRSFVRDIIDDPDDAAITAAIVALAHSLRMKVTAEGVETKAQLDYLKSLHCDEAQGFYFSQPLPMLEFEHLIQQQKIFHIDPREERNIK